MLCVRGKRRSRPKTNSFLQETFSEWTQGEAVGLHMLSSWGTVWLAPPGAFLTVLRGPLRVEKPRPSAREDCHRLRCFRRRKHHLRLGEQALPETQGLTLPLGCCCLSHKSRECIWSNFSEESLLPKDSSNRTFSSELCSGEVRESVCEVVLPVVTSCNMFEM